MSSSHASVFPAAANEAQRERQTYYNTQPSSPVQTASLCTALSAPTRPIAPYSGEAPFSRPALGGRARAAQLLPATRIAGQAGRRPKPPAPAGPVSLKLSAEQASAAMCVAARHRDQSSRIVTSRALFLPVAFARTFTTRLTGTAARADHNSRSSSFVRARSLGWGDCRSVGLDVRHLHVALCRASSPNR